MSKIRECSEHEWFFDEEEALRWDQFFSNYLIHTKGEWAGQDFELDDWQKEDIIYPLVGMRCRKCKIRQYRTAYIELPRKNGKSKIASGLGIGLTLIDGEPGAEVYCAAADTDQARIVFNDAKLMILNNQDLSSRSQVLRDSVYIPSTNSIFRVLSADADTKHGFNAHAVIVDEVHVQPDDELINVLKTSMGSRRQPLMIYITTAGYDRNSVCWQLHEYARKVRDGLIDDPSFLPVIYAADPEDDWTKEETWKKANPGYGISIKKEFLEKECAVAKEMPAQENVFKRLYLNLWTAQNTRWMPMELWLSRATAYDPESLRGQLVWGGLDLSTTTDITALSLLFRDDENVYRTLRRYWVPEENALMRQKRDGVPYLDWIRAGHLNATPGNVVDYDYVRRDINEMGERFDLKKIALDRWNATQIATQLDGDGFEIVMFGQGFASMTSPMKELMTLVLGNRYLHLGDPVTNWMMDNVSAKQDPAGNIKPDKSKSSGRIDGIVADIMALGIAIKDQGDDSIYNHRGLIVL